MRLGRPFGVVLLLAAGVVWLYYSVLSSLVRQWGSDDNYSHGFFVLPLAAYFVWERRARLAAARPRPAVAGVLILALSLTMFLAGRLGAELFLTRASLIGTLAGIVLFVFGREHLRILIFPLAFLILMIPLPAIVFNQIALPLQMFASSVGEGVIRLAGVPVLREGNVLQLPTTTLEVVEACSGIRSLVSLITLAVVLGYFTQRETAGRIILALSAIPIAILANAARVAGTGLASHWLGTWAAEGFFHSFSGWLMFVVAFFALLAVQRTYGVARSWRGHALTHAPEAARC